LIYGLCVSVVAAQEQVTVDVVRQAHVSALDHLRTGWVEYERQISRSRNAQLETLVVERLEYMERQRKERAAKKEADGVEERSANELAENSPSIPEQIRKLRSNQEFRHTEERIDFDASSPTWKTTVSDLRNLDQIAEQQELPPILRETMDTSGVTLTGNGLILRQMAWDKRAYVREDVPPSYVGSPLMRCGLEFGILADNIYRDARHSSLTECSREGRPALCIELELDRMKYEVVVDPAIAYRCRRIRVFAEDGGLSFESVYNDYRRVDGFHFAFDYESTNFDSEGNQKRHEKIKVKSARFNQELPKNALKMERTPDTKLSSPDHILNPAAEQWFGIEDIIPRESPVAK
jgi:hypothetical protein